MTASLHRFTPEGAVTTQVLLGADIQMVLDVCPPLPSPPDVSAWPSSAPRHGRRGPRRSTGGRIRRCSASCKGERRRRMRAESAKRTVEIGFDGYGIGGLSVGEHREEMFACAGGDDRAPARGPAPRT